MDMVVPLVDRSLSAYTLEFELADLIRRIDRLRLAQQRGRPPVKPGWWDDHITDPEWPGRHGRYVSGCREDRIAYLHWKALAAVHVLRGSLPGLLSGIDASPRERSVLQEASTALKVIYDILKAPKLHPRLYWAVVPEPEQLNRTLPDPESPVLPSAHERWLLQREDEIHYEFLQGEIDLPTAEHLVGVIHERLRVLGVQRIAENRRLLRSTAAMRRDTRVADILKGWRRTVKSWGLAEEAIRKAYGLLRGEWRHAPAPPEVQRVRVESMDEHVVREAARVMRETLGTPLAQRPETDAPSPTVSWRQPALNSALWKRVTAGEADIANLERRLRSKTPARVAEARKEAKERWGARALQRLLHVSAHGMITKSPAWLEVARRLGLRTSSRRGKGNRVGMERVVDSHAQRREAKPHQFLAERVGSDDLELALSSVDAASADSLREQMRRGETTPEAVMEIISTLKAEVAP